MYGAKTLPGFASVCHAVIEWKKRGQPQQAIIAPFFYWDGTLAGKQSTRFALLIPY